MQGITNVWWHVIWCHEKRAREKKIEWYHFLKERYLNSVILLDFIVRLSSFSFFWSFRDSPHPRKNSANIFKEENWKFHKLFIYLKSKCLTWTCSSDFLNCSHFQLVILSQWMSPMWLLHMTYFFLP